MSMCASCLQEITNPTQVTTALCDVSLCSDCLARTRECELCGTHVPPGFEFSEPGKPSRCENCEQLPQSVGEEDLVASHTHLGGAQSGEHVLREEP